MSQPLHLLVIGDPYMPVAAYAGALSSLGDEVTVTTMEIPDISSAPPCTESEHRLAEYVGDPADVARAAAGQDVLIAHGAPVSSEVLDAGSRHPLLSAPNIFATPHIGGATAETLARGAQRAVAAVASLLAGHVPEHVVNPQVLHAGKALT